MIATDPEDKNSRAVNPNSVIETDRKLPQCYLKITSDGKNSFVLTPELVMDQPKWFFFKLRSPEENKLSHSLPESRWLPEASGGSQPYFIQPKGERSLLMFRKHKFVYIKRETSTEPERDDTAATSTQTHVHEGATVHVGAFQDGDSGSIISRLFILTPGHKT